MEKKRKDLTFYICIGAMLLISAAVLIVWAVKPKAETAKVRTAMIVPGAQEPIILEKEKVVELVTEKKIEIATVEEKLRDAGFLITQEYYFTDVMSFESAKDLKVFGSAIAKGIFRSGYMVQYDGTVSAGVDFTGITVSRDEELQIVRVEVPPAVIYNTVVDFDSFVLLSEKESLFNKISAEDYNNSLKKLVKDAEAKAVERDVLKSANKNARLLINGMIGSLLDGELYSVRVVTKEV